jgi:hypothetical protein
MQATDAHKGATMHDTITASTTRHATSAEQAADIAEVRGLVTLADRLDAPEVREIRDSTALAIAAGWQSPRGHGLTFHALAATGRVNLTALGEAIASEYDAAKAQGCEYELDLLSTWALNHPSRQD